MNFLGLRRNQQVPAIPPSSVDTFLSVPPTMIGSASEYKEKSLERLLQNQLDNVISSLRDFKIHENSSRRVKAIEYFASGLQAPSHDVAVLGDIEEEYSDSCSSSGPPPKVVAELITFEHGKAIMTTWSKKYTVDKWPLVVYKHTRLTNEEEDRIDTLEIPQLLDMVRKECPDRENVLFPSGYDGMEVATMRRRLKNQLRLDLDELTELTQDGSKTGKKKRIVEYLVRIRPGLIKGT